MTRQSRKTQTGQPSYLQVLKKSSLAFFGMSPLLVAIIGLVGLFEELVTPKMLASLFRGNPWTDTLTGTLVGAAAAGNPIVSYVLGGELLDRGISLYAVCAFMIAWVNLGFIQLPAEIEVFGTRFTFYRNLLAFLFSMLIAAATALTLEVLT